MAEQKKRTQVEILEEMLETLDMTEEEQTELIEKLVANIQKKNAQKSATKSKEHEELEEQIEEILSAEPNRIFTCAEIAKEMGSSTQKLTPRIKTLVDLGKVEKTVEKRTNHYQWKE